MTLYSESSEFVLAKSLSVLCLSNNYFKETHPNTYNFKDLRESLYGFFTKSQVVLRAFISCECFQVVSTVNIRLLESLLHTNRLNNSQEPVSYALIGRLQLFQFISGLDNFIDGFNISEQVINSSDVGGIEFLHFLLDSLFL